MRKRTWTDSALKEAIDSSTSIAQVLRSLGLVARGGNYFSIKRHIERLAINTDHFLGQAHNKGKVLPSPKTAIPLKTILVRDSTYTNNGRLKTRLLREKMLEYRCSKYGISEWQEADLSLHLDHENGNRRDNRLTNLRLLCPNCHSQTDTYCNKK